MNRGGIAGLMGSAIRSTDRRFPDAAFGPYPPNDQKEVSQHSVRINEPVLISGQPNSNALVVIAYKLRFLVSFRLVRKHDPTFA
uniref:Uncharacterized protein n=1 Tax=Candidatus Kentrum sp. DK TaxID=2126562 RepID=A0A450T497_9GAMM|nr:MAG: hypothetical protein BECKDK2373C_GA0170839_108811 [Candidatus Kentron sp. DK]